MARHRPCSSTEMGWLKARPHTGSRMGESVGIDFGGESQYHASAVFWHENGQKSSESTCKNSVPVGVWSNWDEEGESLRRK